MNIFKQHVSKKQLYEKLYAHLLNYRSNRLT